MNTIGVTTTVRSVAFYLPQFHPIPENDEWWGPGFTEWTNVAKARPQFKGHYQPHLPADLGFYDLRLPEARHAQANLARQYGVEGFCYYHYWFGGRRVLGRPIDDVLASGEPDFPFCLCWANENWTRIWDGGDRSVLLPQDYSEADDYRHITWLAQVFSDPRYIRYDDRPLFLVYRALDLPDPRATTERWRQEARRLGVGELFLCRVENFDELRVDPRSLGFDAAVEFQPDFKLLPPSLLWRTGWQLTGGRGPYRHRRMDYATLVERSLSKPAPPYPRFRGVTPSWDNTPRHDRGAKIVTGSTPNLFEEWLATVVARAAEDPVSGGMIFVNAWNEWAEGNHLEPCRRWGRAYLEAHLRALQRGVAAPSPEQG